MLLSAVIISALAVLSLVFFVLLILKIRLYGRATDQKVEEKSLEEGQLPQHRDTARYVAPVGARRDGYLPTIYEGGMITQNYRSPRKTRHAKQRWRQRAGWGQDFDSTFYETKRFGRRYWDPRTQRQIYSHYGHRFVTSPSTGTVITYLGEGMHNRRWQRY